MILVFGGAYQGKLEYVKKKYDVCDADIFDCANSGCEIDFNKKCILHIEHFTLECVRNGIEPKDYFVTNEGKLANAILVCRDVSCGVVPMEPDIREWREATGRLVNYLSRKAERVVRVFCGLPQIIKGDSNA